MNIGGISHTRGDLAEQFVNARRREESTLNHLNGYLKTDLIARHVAGWEIKGEAMEKSRFVKKRLIEMKRDMAAKVQMRRIRLKALYDQEEEQFDQELQKLRPTPEQIKEDMIRKVADLKKRREHSRKEEVAEKLERRFKDGADELRLVQTQIKEVKTKQERDVQMLEKHKRMERDYMEEMMYAELWRRDKLNKERLEQLKAKEAALKNQNRNQILAKQRNAMNQQKEQEKQQTELEKLMLNQEWAKERERERSKF